MSDAPMILLVDDCDADRYFFKRSLRKVAPEAEVVEFVYAQDALSYLKSPGRGAIDIIFVDINMPRFNGFEFADAYHALYPELRGDARLYICSSSINPADRQRTQDHPVISGYCEKPLTRDTLAALI
ncbi:response regulator [Phaeobacter sp. HF9A]|uniref:response regulator n=1 Tax=Phaeobacter sp. HF9A TaxID=2721561 RepID=UPI00143037F5|nr:response regulator [Phaeobacter sp. HF9A]NIZ15073.1 response regulator transcription factor [Phaeobacter sp. HF9A]